MVREENQGTKGTNMNYLRPGSLDLVPRLPQRDAYGTTRISEICVFNALCDTIALPHAIREDTQLLTDFQKFIQSQVSNSNVRDNTEKDHSRKSGVWRV